MLFGFRAIKINTLISALKFLDFRLLGRTPWTTKLRGNSQSFTGLRISTLLISRACCTEKKKLTRVEVYHVFSAQDLNIGVKFSVSFRFTIKSKWCHVDCVLCSQSMNFPLGLRQLVIAKTLNIFSFLDGGKLENQEHRDWWLRPKAM